MIVTLQLHNLCIHTRHKEVKLTRVSAGVVQHECNNHSLEKKKGKREILRVCMCISQG
jgi:hypothetical protein